MRCLLCGSAQVRALAPIPAEKLIEGWRQIFAIDITGELRGRAAVDLFACDNCQLHFFPPELAGSEALYTQLERIDWYYMPRKWEHDVALETLRPGDRVLEVGCGFGDFVARAREAGIDMTGIELSRSAVEEAQRRGHPVELLDLRDAAQQRAGQYDAVCSFQVLEHVPNPRDFLEWSCALLKPGGQLIAAVPNRESFIKDQFELLDMPPHHVTRWSEATMRALPFLLPLRVQHIRREPLAPYHVKAYLSAFFSRHPAPARLYRGRAKYAAIELLKRSRLHRLLLGQTLYAAFAHAEGSPGA